MRLRAVRAIVLVMMALVAMLPLAGAVRASASQGADCKMKCCTRLKQTLCKRVANEAGMRAGAECGEQCGVGKFTAASASVFVLASPSFVAARVAPSRATRTLDAVAGSRSGFDRLQWQRPPPAV